jgi:hypothetical protein
VADYTIHNGGRTADQRIIRCPSPDGYKTRAARLAEALKGRWTHRAGGYVVSPTKAAKFERLYAEGWDGCYMTATLVPPKEEPCP